MRIAVVVPLSAPTTDTTSRGSHIIVANALASAMQGARSMRRSAIRGQAIERFDFDLMLDGYEELLA